MYNVDQFSTGSVGYEVVGRVYAENAEMAPTADYSQ